MRNLVAGLALLVTVVTGTAGGADKAGDDGLEVSFRTLTYGIIRVGAPIPAIVTISNLEPRFSGIIEVWTGKYKTANVASHRVNIGQGKFRFFLYPQTQDAYDDRIAVRVTDADDNVRYEQSAVLHRKSGRLWAAAFGSRNRGLPVRNLPLDETVVLGIRARDYLPDQWWGYRMFDVLFWDGQANATMTSAQRKALADWIKGGGRLILMAREGDTQVVSPIPELVSDRDLADGPVSIERVVGIGSVAIVRVSSKGLSSWSKRDIAELVEYPADSSTASNRVRDPRSAYGGNGELKAILARAAGYVELSFRPVLITILVYILLVSVVDYLILSKIRKLPWTWATFPMCIGVFGVFSFFAFYQGRLGPGGRHEVLFHDVGSDGHGRMLVISCIRKESVRPIVFEVDESHVLSDFGGSDMYWYRRGSEDAKTRIAESVLSASAKRITIPGHVGSFQFFTEEWVPELSEAPFSCTGLSKSGSALTGEIRKNFDSPVFLSFLICGNRVYDVDVETGIISRTFADLNDHQRSRVYYRGYSPRTVGTDDFDLLEAVVDWTRINAKDFLTLTGYDEFYTRAGSGGRFPEGASVYRHLKTPDKALLFAFIKEEGKHAGMRFNRVTCVRQLIDVVRED